MAALNVKLPTTVLNVMFRRNVTVTQSTVLCNRQLWIGAICYNSNQVAKQGKMLKKIMVGGSRKKWYKDPAHVLEKPTPGSCDFLKPKKTQVKRRVSVLNSVLMHNICDVISTGELTTQLVGLGLEITRVKVNNEFICVNVYWTTSIAENSVTIERLLHSNAGELRNILSGLRVLGKIPYIIFVKDHHQQNLKDVEYALARADFGSDFKPTDRTHRLKSSAVLKQTIPDLPELRMDDKVDCTLSQFEPLVSTSTAIPEQMRMDIFGLNHRQILTHVVQKMNAAKACHRTSESGVPIRECPPLGVTEEFGGETVDRKLPSPPDLTAELRRILRNVQREKRRDTSKEEVKRLLTEEIRSEKVGPVLGRNFSELYNQDDECDEEDYELEREK